MANDNVYIAPTVETDEDELADLGMEYLESQVDGWTPHGGNLDTWIIEAVAFMAARIAQMTGSVPATIFRWFGTELMGLPPIIATPATGISTWVVQPSDVASLNIIPNEWQVSIGDQTFAVSGQYTIAPGQASISGVALTAVEEGAQGSGLTEAPRLVNLLPWVASIALDEQTSGGQDGEGNDDYLDRLSSLLRLMGPKLVLPRDVEVFVKQIPAVGRALCIDNYDPTANAGAGAYDVAKTLTVWVLTSEGNDLTGLEQAAVKALLEANRETNFRFFVRSPTRNTVAVTYAATAFRDFDPDIVKLNVDAALAQYFDPAYWGSPNFGDGGEDLWVKIDRVRFGELYAVLNGVEGLDFVSNLTISINGGAPVSNQDAMLPGIVSVTTPGALTGTVVKP